MVCWNCMKILKSQRNWWRSYYYIKIFHNLPKKIKVWMLKKKSSILYCILSFSTNLHFILLSKLNLPANIISFPMLVSWRIELCFVFLRSLSESVFENIQSNLVNETICNVLEKVLGFADFETSTWQKGEK